jgi:negative modulator of initiation of replication
MVPTFCGEASMPVLRVDEFVYGYVRGAAEATGTDDNTVMRKLIEEKDGQKSAAKPHDSAGELEGFFSSANARADGTAKERLLALLGWLHAQHREEFQSVLKLSGHTRRYFARSANELRDHGKSVNPKQIPGSPYWVVTNSATARKQELIAHVLKLMGYGSEAIGRAQRFIAGA